MYQYVNKDLPEFDRRAIFVHALKAASSSQPDEPMSLPELPDMCVRIARPARFAIVLHLFYRDMWEEFATRLQRQCFPYDLFITLGGKAAADPDLERHIR